MWLKTQQMINTIPQEYGQIDLFKYWNSINLSEPENYNLIEYPTQNEMKVFCTGYIYVFWIPLNSRAHC